MKTNEQLITFRRENENAIVDVTYDTRGGWSMVQATITAKHGPYDYRHLRQKDFRELLHHFPSAKEVKEKWGSALQQPEKC